MKHPVPSPKICASIFRACSTVAIGIALAVLLLLFSPKMVAEAAPTPKGIGSISNSPLPSLPSISINNTSVVEGNSGTTPATFTITLNYKINSPITVSYATQDGTAVAGIDYIQKTDVLTIPSNTKTVSLVVDVIGDRVAEGDKTFKVNLIGPVHGATIQKSQGVCTIIDDDHAGISIFPTSGLTTTKTGGNASFMVWLTSQPTATVSFNVASSNITAGIIGIDHLTFNTNTWDITQTVTVTGQEDHKLGNIPYKIITSHSVSADPKYNNIKPQDVELINIDDEKTVYLPVVLKAPGVKVTPTSGLITTEAGGTATFSVALTQKPTDDVSIRLSSSNESEGTVSPNNLTFTSANWNTPQIVTITGVDDSLLDGDVVYKIILDPLVSDDIDYKGIKPDDVTVTNLDDDIFYDDFSTDRGWSVVPYAGGSARIDTVAGKYYLKQTIQNTNYRSIAPFPAQNSPYSVEAHMSLVSGTDPNAKVGLIFDWFDINRFYLFIIQPDTQTWWVYKWQDGWVKLATGSSSAILAGEGINHLRLERNGSSIKAWINDIPVTPLIPNDSSYTNGQAGLIIVATTFPSYVYYAEAAFDDFLMERLP
jgi:hypothetical protein